MALARKQGEWEREREKAVTAERKFHRDVHACTRTIFALLYLNYPLAMFYFFFFFKYKKPMCMHKYLCVCTNSRSRTSPLQPLNTHYTYEQYTHTFLQYMRPVCVDVFLPPHEATPKCLHITFSCCCCRCSFLIWYVNNSAVIFSFTKRILFMCVCYIQNERYIGIAYGGDRKRKRKTCTKSDFVPFKVIEIVG